MQELSKSVNVHTYVSVNFEDVFSSSEMLSALCIYTGQTFCQQVGLRERTHIHISNMNTHSHSEWLSKHHLHAKC